MALLNCELVSRVKLCLVSVFPDIVTDCSKMRNLAKIFLRSSRMWPGMWKTHKFIPDRGSLASDKLLCLGQAKVQMLHDVCKYNSGTPGLASPAEQRTNQHSVRRS